MLATNQKQEWFSGEESGKILLNSLHHPGNVIETYCYLINDAEWYDILFLSIRRLFPYSISPHEKQIYLHPWSILKIIFVIGIPYGVEQNSGGIFTPSPTNPVLIGFRKKIEYHNYFGTGFPSFLNARFLRRHLNSSFSKSSC